MADRIQSFDEFWPYYLGEHRLAATRWMHFAGSTLALMLTVSSVATQTWLGLIAVPFCGYAFAWFSHFFIEKNKPASFKYPLWSLAADWKMWSLMLTGRLDAHLTRFSI